MTMSARGEDRGHGNNTKALKSIFPIHDSLEGINRHWEIKSGSHGPGYCYALFLWVVPSSLE